MNKKLLIIGGIVILVLIIVGLFVLKEGNTNKEDINSTNLANTELQADLELLDQVDEQLDSNEASEIIEVE